MPMPPPVMSNLSRDKTRQITQDLLLNENLDVQVIFYDIATSLPPDEMPEE